MPGSSAAELRETGNGLFKEQRYTEAAEAYRQALTLLEDDRPQEEAGEASHGAAATSNGATLGQALRLNLATCLLRLQGASLQEAIELCDNALEVDDRSVKALFLRGSAQRGLAEALVEPDKQRSCLQAARRDLLQAARTEPKDRQVRQTLEDVTEALRRLSIGGGGGGMAAGFLGQRGDARGLYADRESQEHAPAPPVVCSVCGRQGHAQCGRDLWVQQRAQWLGVPEDEAGREPASYEDNGTLLKLCAKRAREGLDEERRGRLDTDFSDLSEEEKEMLEDCLDSTEKPYPQIKRRLPLPQAVRCAEDLWAED